MAQYIDKYALVAEIEKRIRESLDLGGSTRGVYISERIKEDSHILSFIDTLEVKDVDLEEEIVNYINRHYHIRFDETLERGNDPLTTIDFEEIAKYFFELGLKAQKEEKTPEGMY